MGLTLLQGVAIMNEEILLLVKQIKILVMFIMMLAIACLGIAYVSLTSNAHAGPEIVNCNLTQIDGDPIRFSKTALPVRVIPTQ